MRFNKNIWTFMALAMVAFIAMTGDAFAANGIMELVKDKLISLFLSVKSIVFILGGFGLVVVAFLAIFGKINWKWFAGLAVGLAVLAAAGAVIKYSTGDTEQTGRMQDTFEQSGV